MEEKLQQVRRKIMRIRTNENMKLMFVQLFNTVGLPEKKMNIFLKMENSNVQLGFLFRLLLSSAYKYGVPHVYIKECLDFKKSYIKTNVKSKPKRFSAFGGRWNDYDSYEEDNSYKIRMQGAYTKLLYATIEMAKTKTSRKEKISKVLEKIADKNN